MARSTGEIVEVAGEIRDRMGLSSLEFYTYYRVLSLTNQLEVGEIGLERFSAEMYKVLTDAGWPPS